MGLIDGQKRNQNIFIYMHSCTRTYIIMNTDTLSHPYIIYTHFNDCKTILKIEDTF